MENMHIPVLLKESLDILEPQSGEMVLDVTLGLGGHAEALIEASGHSGTLIGIDADAKNLEVARQRLRRFGGRVTLHHANFRMLSQLGLPQVDILLADLGLSSPHIDDPERGFAFRSDAPLDLRFDQTSGTPASAMLRDMNEDSLRRMFQEYGEVPGNRSLASKLFQELRRGSMKEGNIQTSDIVRIVESMYGFRAPSILPQVFQALRIAVNDELEALKTLLVEGPKLLKPGGRMGIISYHSLEDRMVKEAFRDASTPEIDSVTGAPTREAPFELLTKKAVQPSDSEIARNPRSRSARLRAVRRRKV